MPFYDFKCPVCEVVKTITAKMDTIGHTEVPCPECSDMENLVRMNRLWSSTAKVKFNGAGFSCNDLNGRSQKII